MKISMTAKTLTDLINIGGAASLIKEVQDENIKKSKPLYCCFKITASDKTLTMESASPKFASVSCVTSDDIVVKEGGSCCVESVPYMKVLSTLSPNNIIELSSPEEIKVGTKLSTTVFINDKEKRKGKNEVYSSKEFSKINYNFTKEIFSVPSSLLAKAVNSVLFATEQADMVNDKICILIKDNCIYFSGTNSKQIAIYKISGDTKDVKISVQSYQGLIAASTLDSICGILKDCSSVSVIDCENKQHIVFKSGNISIKTSLAPEEVVSKFPNFGPLLETALDYCVVADKKDLESAVNFTSQYNDEKSIVEIKVDEEKIKLMTAGVGHDAEYALVACDKITNAPKDVFAISNQNTKKAIKYFSGDKIRMEMDKECKKIKMSNPDNDSFVYFMAAMLIF